MINLFRFGNRSRFSFTRTQLFGWVTIVLSIAICGMVVWHHNKEKRTIVHTLTVLDTFRQARIDLMEGFLCVCLAENTPPLDISEGEAELKEAIATFESTTDQINEFDKKCTLLFQQKVQAFRDKLFEWKRSQGAFQKSETVAVRIAFDDLVRQADQLDQLTRAHARIRAAQNSDRFGVALVVSAFLLSVICATVLYMGYTSKRLEETSLEFAGRFREAMEAIDDGLWDHNLKTGARYHSPGMWKTLGYSDADWQKLINTWMDLLHPDDQEAVHSLYQECTQSRCDNFEIEFRLKAKNGSWRWILSRGKVVKRDLSGKAVRIVGTHVDITERKQAEEALRASEEQFRAIFQVVSIGIVQIDPQTGQFIRFNDAYLKITGYSAKELYTLRFPELTHPDDREKDWKIFSSAVRGEIPSYANEKRYIRKDGSVIWVLINASFLRNKAGQAIRSVAICKDITQRKIAEDERAKLQDQLMQVQKMDSIGRLAGGIAHDFNNILGIIIGHADLMRDHIEIADPLVEDVDEIQKAASRAADLTRQLLAFARKQAVSPQVLDLNETIGDMLKMLKRLINENIELVWHPGEALGSVFIDSVQVDQILANLCVNARDAIEKTGTITISTSNASFDATQTEFSPGDYVVLTVRDTGCGMSPAIQPHIFEPFFTTKKIGHGTGLGLSTVYGIVKQNNGFIRVVSKPGEGATFQILFPRHTAEMDKNVVAVAVSEKKGRGEVILLVEDDLTLLKLITIMLQGEGYVVLGTPRPRDAIRIAENRKQDIRMLLSDIVMPDMNGYEMERQIRKHCPALVALFMSGYADVPLPNSESMPAATYFIRKPFSQHALSEKVRSALDARPEQPTETPA